MKFYRCEVCGLILEEGQMEDHCPKCNAPREKFAELDPETAGAREAMARLRLLTF